MKRLKIYINALLAENKRGIFEKITDEFKHQILHWLLRKKQRRIYYLKVWLLQEVPENLSCHVLFFKSVIVES